MRLIVDWSPIKELPRSQADSVSIIKVCLHSCPVLRFELCISLEPLMQAPKAVLGHGSGKLGVWASIGSETQPLQSPQSLLQDVDGQMINWGHAFRLVLRTKRLAIDRQDGGRQLPPLVLAPPR